MGQLLEHVLVPEAKTPAMDAAVAEAWLHHMKQESKRLEVAENPLPLGWFDLLLEAGGDVESPVFECQEEFLRAYR